MLELLTQIASFSQIGRNLYTANVLDSCFMSEFYSNANLVIANVPNVQYQPTSV